jgi:hypothetical protein
LEEHPDYGEEILCKQLDRNRSSYEHIFKAIDGEYKILKSGFAKEDSQLMLYFDEEKNIEWEKPSIKRKLVGRGSGGKSDLTTNEKVKYVRALLGVAELYEFPQRRSKVHIECYDKEGNPPKTAIERFRSPLTFKVFDDTIYILTNPIPDEIYDKTFRFYNDNGQVLINTPPKSADFDLKDFLENHTHESWNYVSE